MAGGIGASLTVASPVRLASRSKRTSGWPARCPTGKVHTRIGSAGVELFLRPASGADIPLVPFAGLGALSAAAEAALPFLLDKLAELPGTPGDLVRTVGDALALRSGSPKRPSAPTRCAPGPPTRWRAHRRRALDHRHRPERARAAAGRLPACRRQRERHGQRAERDGRRRHPVVATGGEPRGHRRAEHRGARHRDPGPRSRSAPPDSTNWRPSARRASMPAACCCGLSPASAPASRRPRGGA